jgi:ribonuclease P/MRP protein subunit RPP40
MLQVVPQGSGLGPLLFLLYIKDLCNSSGDSLSVKLLADDVKIYAELNSTDSCDKIQVFQDGLNKLYDWSKACLLNVSLNKCFVLHVGHIRSEYYYNIGGASLKYVSQAVDLGVTVDSKLRIDQQVAHIIRKAHQRAALIRCF